MTMKMKRKIELVDKNSPAVKFKDTNSLFFLFDIRISLFLTTTTTKRKHLFINRIN